MAHIKYLICSVFLVAATAVICSLVPNADAQSQIDFKREIEPIFARTCYQCHGPRNALGQLRLDVKALAMKGGLSGPSIIPGNSKESRLMQRILGEGDEMQMPMGGDPLKPAQIELIRKWIDQGAKWPEAGAAQETAVPTHWAYRTPVRPRLPRVKNLARVRNPIDRFILARLEKEGLHLSAEADKATLLRRLYLDITGLPPGVKEVDQFLADKSPNAYEKVVDRLLASPHYGERWARPWLDLARYADSNGYEADHPRVMWKYRDWVINALNRDLPFDQFTIEQIAGDMLPTATLDQRIATGFHRNTMVNQEGGIDPEENRFEILVDRVNTTGTVWLGSTIACAQCHNHKYDPFSQRDYYRFMAFFDNAEFQIASQSPGDQNSRYVLEPQLSLPTPDQEAKRNSIEMELKELEAKLKTSTPELESEQAKWEREELNEHSNWTVLDPLELESSGGATMKKLSDNSVLVSGKKAENDLYLIKARTDLKGITGLRLEAITDESLPKGGPGRDPYGNFFLTGLEVEISPLSQAQPLTIKFKDALVDDSAYGLNVEQFFSSEPGNVATDAPPGWFINATRDEQRLARNGVFIPEAPFGFEGGTALTIKLKHLGGSLNQGIGRFRLSLTTTREPKRIASLSARLRPILSLPGDARTKKQKDDLAARFRATTPIFKQERERMEKLRQEMRSSKITTALVMQERKSDDTPSTFFRERGSFLNKGEKVQAATPAALPPMPADVSVNRLGLARWLVDENNPLTARVTVNRIWEQVFGHGIVETSEDFGIQCEPPTHPELLDWLAVEFIHPTWNERVKGKSRGWSMKKLIRLIVTSSTYRQSSATTPAVLEKDPYNRLLARGPRFRLEAEMIRDLTLTASGLLSRKIGGPSVFPLQPDGVWNNPYSSEKWIVSQGEDRYRRGLYTFVRRSSPHPAMITFDATSREYCTVRRVRTNTPLQALTMLNDEAAMEAARAMARRMLAEGGEKIEGRIIYGLRSCIARAPKEQEILRLAKLYEQQLNYFRAHEAEAGKLLNGQLKPSSQENAAELAAWTMVSNVLLNLDETLTKE
ncbi:MAG: PSD1 and planctomycete cytochrome C domain-containing protein [Acidobacteria bacterium]|nr:PSD1 and planctomycete cytochrome C domain-containing protein [Acidobacteriota bacterium]